MIVTRFLCFVGFLFLLNLSLPTIAQDNHFLYIQSEAGQPFYAKLNGKLYSSTASGYIIVSQLKRGEYRLSIGFPRNEFPEQEYPIIIADENQGLLLKDANNQRVLVNMESKTQIASLTPVAIEEKAAVDTTPTKEPLSSDLFSSLLANAVRDSSLLQTSRPPVEKITAAAPLESEALKTNSSTSAPGAVAKSPEEERVEVAPQTAETVNQTKPKEKEDSAAEVNTMITKVENPFKRVLLVNQENGQDMIYVNSATQDSIRLFVQGHPMADSESAGARIIYKPEVAEEENLTITPTVVHAPETAADEKKEAPNTARIIYEPESDNKEKEDSVTAEHKIKATVSVNSDCTSFANEKDFLRLRRRMAGESDAMKMIDAARRFFKSKCYTTEQIRNLSYLFMDDEGRYQFFDAAYPHVSDSNLFAGLESQLEDPYYINRFKAMIQK